MKHRLHKFIDLGDQDTQGEILDKYTFEPQEIKGE